MKLEKDILLEDFRDEMQHRVVKYPLRSRPVKEGLRFAKRHSDPAFHRIATDKIHAQAQFQREMYGPSKLEKLVDFLTLGSLRELFVMMMLVVAGIAGVETVKSFYSALNPPEPHVDIDELAKKLNLGLESFDERDQSVGNRGDGFRPLEWNDQSATDQSKVINELANKIAKILIENGDLEIRTENVRSKTETKNSSNNKTDQKHVTESAQLAVATPVKKEIVTQIDLADAATASVATQDSENE